MTVKAFGRKVKARRVLAKLTQKQLGRKLGHTTGQLVSNIERGNYVPSTEMRKRVAKALGMRA